jgi:hypothetical protein
MKTKHLVKFHIIYHDSCTSPFTIVGPIPGSHVFVITCTLGWDDGTSLAPKVEDMACDCYAKYKKVPSCPSAPHHQFPIPHP